MRARNILHFALCSMSKPTLLKIESVAGVDTKSNNFQGGKEGAFSVHSTNRVDGELRRSEEKIMMHLHSGQIESNSIRHNL